MSLFSAAEEVPTAVADVLFIIAAALFLLDGMLRLAGSDRRDRGLVEFGLALVAIGFVVVNRVGV